jgi:hypothetical protein
MNRLFANLRARLDVSPWALGLLAASAVACGSSNSPAPAASTHTDAGIGSLAAEDQVPPSCVNFSTGFAGDNVCIQPPPAGTGYQFHYGPSNYNDPVEVAKYTLQPGQETTDCVFFMMPNTDTVFFQAYNARMRPGSHHMLLYLQGQQATETQPGEGPRDCAQGLDTRVLFGAQTPVIDVNGLTAGAPENEGLAADIPPNQQAVLQAHFINAGTKPILREVWANMRLVDKSQVTQQADFQFFIGGGLMNVPQGTSQTVGGQATVPNGVAPDFRMIMGTGHYHAHTTRFQAWATVDGQKVPMIDEYNTLGIAPDPANWYFDTGRQNPLPDTAKKASGAFSGILHLKPGDTVSWSCDVTNDNVPGGIKFGNYVYSAEMCNFFGFYAPGFGTKGWQAFSP